MARYFKARNAHSYVNYYLDDDYDVEGRYDYFKEEIDPILPPYKHRPRFRLTLYSGKRQYNCHPHKTIEEYMNAYGKSYMQDTLEEITETEYNNYAVMQELVN